MLDSERKLEEYLVRWQSAREDGVDVSVEELCDSSPDLSDELQRRIEVLRASEWVLEDPTEDEGGDDAPSRLSDALPRGDLSTQVPAASLTVAGGPTLDEFLTAVEDAQLASRDTLAEVLASLASEPSSEPTLAESNNVNARRLARELVSRGVMTSFQAEALLDRTVPLVLDRYVLQDRLGAGGMGQVYKARHRAMGRSVAIKVLPLLAQRSPDRVRRFRREIKTVAQLSHPHIVSALDAHESDGLHFLVMEFVQGLDLRRYVARHGVLTPDLAAELIGQVASGLEEAHRQGIIHRDVKPANIMITNEGQAKLLDLGLSRIDNEPPTQSTATELTSDGLALGTSAYMPPEQAMDARRADARADMYSLGCTWFFLVQGRSPFDQGTTVKTMLAHREQPIPSLSMDSNPLSVQLDKVFRRMVQKLPGDRFASMTEFRQKLRELGICTEIGQPLQPLQPPNGNATGNGTPLHITPLSSNGSGRLSHLSSRETVDLPAEPKRSLARRWTMGLVTVACVAVLAAAGYYMAPPSQRTLASQIIQDGGLVIVDTAAGPRELADQAAMPARGITISGVMLPGDPEPKPHGFPPGEEPPGFNQPDDWRSEYWQVAVPTLQRARAFDLTNLSRLPRLSRLSLPFHQLAPAQCQALMNLHSIRMLDLRECRSETEVVSNRTYAPGGLDKLEFVQLAGSELDAATLEYLLSRPQLRIVGLSYTSLAPQTLRQLPETVRILSMCGSQNVEEALVACEHLSQLETIELMECPLSGGAVRSLAKLTNLRHLSLSCDKDTSLDPLGKLQQLRRLSLDSASLSEKQIASLARLSAIRQLSLVNCGVDDHQSMHQLAALDSLEMLVLPDSFLDYPHLVQSLRQELPECDVLLPGDPMMPESGFPHWAFSGLMELQMLESTMGVGMGWPGATVSAGVSYPIAEPAFGIQNQSDLGDSGPIVDKHADLTDWPSSVDTADQIQPLTDDERSSSEDDIDDAVEAAPNQ